MIDCLNAARYFIIRAYEDGLEAEMTNMKVQKLLYYAQSLHLALYNDMKELGYQKLDRIERDRPAYELTMSEIVNDAFASESLNRIGKGEVHDWLNSLLD